MKLFLWPFKCVCVWGGGGGTVCTVNSQIFRTLFSLFSKRMLVAMVLIHKLTNEEDPEQTTSSEAV